MAGVFRPRPSAFRAYPGAGARNRMRPRRLDNTSARGRSAVSGKNHCGAGWSFYRAGSVDRDRPRHAVDQQAMARGVLARVDAPDPDRNRRERGFGWRRRRRRIRRGTGWSARHAGQRKSAEPGWKNEPARALRLARRNVDYYRRRQRAPACGGSRPLSPPDRHLRPDRPGAQRSWRQPAHLIAARRAATALPALPSPPMPLRHQSVHAGYCTGRGFRRGYEGFTVLRNAGSCASRLRKVYAACSPSLISQSGRSRKEAIFYAGRGTARSVQVHTANIFSAPCFVRPYSASNASRRRA